jgi:hypothetical protein
MGGLFGIVEFWDVKVRGRGVISDVLAFALNE